MGIITWIVLGLIAGFIASLMVNRHGEGPFADIILGIIGAVLGGFVARLIGFSGITGFNLWSVLIAVVGAVICLLIYHAAIGRGRPAH
jgi:uncharacterized membrane protein YeaQ/YmgE (transglycosylase-associated protein family)